MESTLLGRFKSPVRVLVRKLLESRSNWKKKCQEARRDIKRYKNEANDIRRSREQWRTRAEAGERAVESLRYQIEQLQEEVRRKELLGDRKAAAMAPISPRCGSLANTIRSR